MMSFTFNSSWISFDYMLNCTWLLRVAVIKTWAFSLPLTPILMCVLILLLKKLAKCLVVLCGTANHFIIP